MHWSVKQPIYCFTERKSYMTVLCTGYIKMWLPSSKTMPVSNSGASKVLETEDDGSNGENSEINLNSLIAVAIPVGDRTGPGYDDLAKVSLPAHIPPLPSIAESELRSKNLEFISRHSADGKFIYADHR